MSKLLDVCVDKVKSIFDRSDLVSDRNFKTNFDRDCYFNLQIITQFYPPDYAATGQLIQELAVQLSQQKVNVRVFTGQPGYAYTETEAPIRERLKSLFIRRSRISQIWSQQIRGKAINGLLFCVRSFFYLCKFRKQNDLLLATSAPAFLPIFAYFAHLLFKQPYVCLVYDLYPDAVTELKVLSKKNFLVRIWNNLNRRVWQSSEAIIVLSSTMKDRIVAKTPDVADKISIIHNWADSDRIKPISKQNNWFAIEHKLTDKFTVLYSGNLGRCHDTNTILAAATLLKEEPIQFVFVGGGFKHSDVARLTKELDLDNCLFLPYQDKKDIPYSLTACDLSLVSIAPGLEGVVAPSKLYGMLAAGRPIAAICESHSYLRPLLAKARCGAAFKHNDSMNLADYIRFLSLNPDIAAQMGQSGRQYLESHFTLEIIAEQYLQVLQASLKEGRGQKAGGRRQKPQVTSHKSEGRRQEAEATSHKSEVF
jgi:glycosyltransferase involved in cell wall biosynthesis